MKKSKLILALLTSLSLITACQPVTQLTPKSPLLQREGTSEESSILTIKGKVEFHTRNSLLTNSSPFTLKALVSDIATDATVSLIYPGDHPTFPNKTIATGLTDTNGNFRINPYGGFVPEINKIYVLEALKRIGGSGNSVLTLRTHVRWNGNGWESITTPGIYINTKTTALAVISGLRGNDLPSSKVIGKLLVVNGTFTVNDISGTPITADTINKVETLVNSVLGNNRDPLQYITYNLGLFSMVNPQKIPNPDSGKIFTVAGGGVGDGDLATNAPIGQPVGVAVDSSGNLYIAEGGELMPSRIRKVNVSTGIITTVAGNGNDVNSGDGGPATSAYLNGVQGLALDASGNIFIAQPNCIRKVNVSTGIITTVAGIGNRIYSGDGGPATSAGLGDPHGVAVDASGNIFIADTFNGRIRKVDASTGIITTIAGGGSGLLGFEGPATSAYLGYTYGVALDTSGNIFINNGTSIRKVTASTGIITAVAGGNGKYGYSGEGGPATNASLSGSKAGGLVVDTSGNIFIADFYGIRKVTASTGIITTIAGGANGTGFSGDGGSATSGSLNGAKGVALDTSGNIFIADAWNGRIRKVTASTGIITTVAGNGSSSEYLSEGGAATKASLNYPSGVVVDPSGNIFIADSGNNRIRKVNASTGIITTVAGDGYKDIYGNGRFSGDGGAATSASLSFHLYYDVVGIALDTSGNLFISDTQNHRIRKVDKTTGIISTLAGNGTSGFSGDGEQATNASIWEPGGIAVDVTGNIFIADSGNKKIRKVNASTGIITTVAGGGSGYSGDGGEATNASLIRPDGIAVDVNGNIFIADSGNGRIRKVNASTGIITTIAGGGSVYPGDGSPATSVSFNYLSGIALDSIGNIFISQSSRIRKVNASTGIITTIAGGGSVYTGDGALATSVFLYEVQGLALDSSGNIFFADTRNNIIRKVIN